jgi:peptide/nickel transport system permease protein
MSQPSQQDEIMAEEASLRGQEAAGIEPVSEARGLSQGQIVRKRFLGHSGAIVGLAVFAIIFVMAFTSVGYAGIPGWWKYTHEAVSPLVNDGTPTASLWPLAWGEHPFGQDRIGRDLFAMTMRGAQQSITIMVVIGLIAGLIGVVVGALLPGLDGSRPDEAHRRHHHRPGPSPRRRNGAARWTPG